jgi:hypothetical protein
MTYGSMHAYYSEFLADTSSFVNTSGGDLDDVVHRLKQRGDPWRVSEDLPPPGKGHPTQ